MRGINRMKKIPSLFKRNYETHVVYDEISEGCEWITLGEGIATRKYDGTACIVINGKLYKRYDVKKGCANVPVGGIPCQSSPDAETGHWPWWAPVTDKPEDKYHREAFTGAEHNGTYELCGPKVNGNPEKYDFHVLIPHGMEKYPLCPRTFNEVRDFIKAQGIEGIVWHHPDCRMCKIKLRDFGIRREVVRG